jgi:hypothetical protein
MPKSTDANRANAHSPTHFSAADEDDLTVIAVGPGGAVYLADSAAPLADGLIAPDLAISRSVPAPFRGRGGPSEPRTQAEALAGRKGEAEDTGSRRPSVPRGCGGSSEPSTHAEALAGCKGEAEDKGSRSAIRTPGDSPHSHQRNRT